MATLALDGVVSLQSTSQQFHIAQVYQDSQINTDVECGKMRSVERAVEANAFSSIVFKEYLKGYNLKAITVSRYYAALFQSIRFELEFRNQTSIGSSYASLPVDFS